MAGFIDILGTMIQQGMTKSSGSRMSSALGGGQSRESLNDILDSLSKMTSSGQAAESPTPQSGPGGLGGVLGDVLNSLGNNKAVAGGLGALVGAMLEGGRSSTRGAVGGGGLAMLASLAFSALKQSGQIPQQPSRAFFEPQNAEEQQTLEQDAEAIVKAMINAAKADGHIDESEIQKSVSKLEKDGLTQEEKSFFLQEAK